MFAFSHYCAILEPQRRRIRVIGFIFASIVTFGIIKGAVDFVKAGCAEIFAAGTKAAV